MCQECFLAISVLPSRIAAAIKRRAVFNSENVSGQWSKSTTMTCEHQVKAHAIFDKIKCAWRAYHTRQYKFLLKSAFLCWKTLDKTACLWYHISCKWARLTTQHFLFRGIAQLVEQRSPNVNAATNICINTELSRLGTSVSSLFSCLRFWKMLKLFMQNRGQNLQKITEDHQKTSTFPTAEKGYLILFWVMEISCSG